MVDNPLTPNELLALSDPPPLSSQLTPACHQSEWDFKIAGSDEKPLTVRAPEWKKGQKQAKKRLKIAKGKSGFTVFHRFRVLELLPGRGMCFGFGFTRSFR